MADGKIEIKVGAVSFSGEGDGKWLSDQLDKVLEKIPELANVAPPPTESDSGGGPLTTGPKRGMGTLAGFLNAKNARSNKTRKFLATALWLQETTGSRRLSTSDITKALSQNSQGDVGNASQCLNLNVGRGFCTKEGRQFYVTDEGKTKLA